MLNIGRRTNPGALPVPTQCPYCQGAVVLTENRAIYGKPFGRWPYAYWCQPCDAYVGLHPNTISPLGTLANARLRSLRKIHKAVFIALLDAGRFKSRGHAYSWLAKVLAIPNKDCHWGHFDEATCEAAGALCRGELERFLASAPVS